MKIILFLVSLPVLYIGLVFWQMPVIKLLNYLDDRGWCNETVGVIVLIISFAIFFTPFAILFAWCWGCPP